MGKLVMKKHNTGEEPTRKSGGEEMKLKKSGKIELRRGWETFKERFVLSSRRGFSSWMGAAPRRRLVVGVLSFLVLLAIGWGIGRQIGFAGGNHPLIVKETTGSPEAGNVDLNALVQELQKELSTLRHQVEQKSGVPVAQAQENVRILAPLELIPPVAGKVIRQSGWEKKGEEWWYHSGVDLTVPPGTQVRATADGTVASIKTEPILGTVVAIDHGSGWRSLYAHLARVQVAVGQELTQGTPLGYSSGAGCGPEPGIHFNLYHQEEPVDPVTMIHFP